MREECSMAKREARRARRAFTPEFKAEAVRLCKVGDRTMRPFMFSIGFVVQASA